MSSSSQSQDATGIVVKCTEYNFLLCIKNSLWGNRQDRLKDLKTGDYIFFHVDRMLAAIARVSGRSFYETTKIWEDDVYPYRIRLHFERILRPEDRPPPLGKVKEALVEVWGPTYGWGIQTSAPLSPSACEKLVEIASGSPHWVDMDLDSELARARQQFIAVEQIQPKKSRPADLSSRDDVVVSREPISGTTREEPPTAEHTHTQWMLMKLGLASGCAVWVASNDRGRSYKGEQFSELCMSELPAMGLADEVVRTIKLIDILWFRGKAPVAAFEVEQSTSVYSGLLRLADLITLIPTLKIELYVVADQERYKKVVREINRPTFAGLGLTEVCRFIPSERLESLLDRTKSLSGHITPSVIRSVAQDCIAEEAAEG